MRNCTANEGEDLSRWDYEQTMEEDGCPNIYRFLCNNIHSYDHAYREGRTLKDERTQREFKLYPFTCEIEYDKCVHELQQEEKRLTTECSEIEEGSCLQNLNVNLLSNIRHLRQKYSQTTNANLNIRNLQFNKLNPGYVRKKDRYKEIFGERPKFIYIKADDKEGLKKNHINNSVALFRPR